MKIGGKFCGYCGNHKLLCSCGGRGISKLKSKIAGEILEIVPRNEPLSRGYALGMGDIEGITVKDSKGNYFFITEDMFESFWKLYP